MIRCLVERHITDIIVFTGYEDRIIQHNYHAVYVSNLGYTKTSENRCGVFYKNEVQQVIDLWLRNKEDRPYGELWMPEEELIVVVISRSKKEADIITSIPIFLYEHFGRIQEGLQKDAHGNNGTTREPARLALKRLEGFLDEHCDNIQAAATKIAGLVQYK